LLHVEIFVFLFIHHILTISKLIESDLSWNFICKLCILQYSCCISQFVLVCHLIVLQDNFLFCSISCDLNWIQICVGRTKKFQFLHVMIQKWWYEKANIKWHVDSSLEIVIENGQLRKPKVAPLKPTLMYDYH